MKHIQSSFYINDTLNVAGQLLGKLLVRQYRGRRWIGRIVETEAYIGEDDPACHAAHGFTPRTQIMYGPPGFAYVYFTYGMHFMLNIVTEKAGFPAAVLIRALEPVSGFDGKDPRPASGPGKLCKSMKIDLSLNGVSLAGPKLWIGEPDPAPEPDHDEVRWSARIGIRVGADRIWRAYLRNNPYVSRKSNPSDPKAPYPLSTII